MTEPQQHLARIPRDELLRLQMETRALLRRPQDLPHVLVDQLRQYERDIAAVIDGKCIDMEG